MIVKSPHPVCAGEMSGEKQLDIVIVGAGIAGLATAYGLLETSGIRVRVLERRKGQCNSVLLLAANADPLTIRGGMRTTRISNPSFAREPSS